MKRSQRFVRRLCAAVVFLVLARSGAVLATEPEGVIKAGVIIPLSGALQAVGESFKNSVILAAQELEIGRRRVEFVFEDDGFDPKRALLAAAKLLHADKVAALIVFGSGSSFAVADLAERAKKPALAVCMSAKVIKDKEFVFRLFLTAEAQTKAVTAGVKNKGYVSLAVVNAAQEAMAELKDLFIAEGPGQIVLKQEVLPADLDLRAAALRVKAAQPAAVYLLLMPPQLSSFARQLREAGYHGELFSSIQAQNIDEINTARGALEGMWFVTFNDSGAEKFYRRYEERFREAPMPDGLFGYDAAKLVINGSGTGDLAGYLRSIKSFKGLLGEYDLSNAGTFVPPVLLKTVRGGKFETAF